MKRIWLCILAGIGAGVGTGFAGLSAAAVISPMLITLLGVDPYEAVGISLASDVLASAVSAYTYGKRKNLDIRNGLIMLAAVLVFAVIGSFTASVLPSTAMGSFSVLMTLLVGLKFLIWPVTKTMDAGKQKTAKQKAVQSVICGIVVGFCCGFVGAGGGMMILLILTCILGYELKTAVGTSVFIMAFTACVGAVSHFAFQASLPDLTMLLTCMVSTLVSAHVAADFANRAPTKLLNRITGAFLTCLGAAMLFVEYVL